MGIMNLIRNVNLFNFQLLSVLFFVVFLLGALNLHFNDRKDYCAMTYMFEYPQFVHISVEKNSLYPQYGLYSYSEGRLTEKARKMWFDGVPVLFLPGNSGSHMQVRSLASVALRKGFSTTKYNFHFDYFTVSYNEDLSGVYGGVLERETDFTVACIEEILNLYKANKYIKTIPTTVILIGHSMGGVIAKRLLAYPLTMNVTSLAITLAAPLQAPVINFDVYMNEYYTDMNEEWRYLGDEAHRRKVLISLGNGPKDKLMPSGLTSSEHTDLEALTTAIPGVWVSPNHVSIVWCKQVVLTMNRYLFSIINMDTQQLTTDKDLIIARAKSYFHANRSIYLDPNKTRPTTTMFPDAFWYEDNRRIYQISRPEVDTTTYLMIRLMESHQHRFLAVEAVRVEDRDWLFGCNAMFTTETHRYCKEGTSLSELSRWTGAAADYGKRKVATIHLHDIKQKHPDWTHVIVRVAPSKKPIKLNVDINDLASRRITSYVPFGLPFAKHTLIEQSEAKSLYYEILLPELTMVYQAYLLYVEPTRGCRASKYHVSAELHLPWAEGHETFHYFTPSKRSPMKLRLFKSKPEYDLSESAKVILMLDPICTFSVRIESSWYYSLAQMARSYTPSLISYVAAIFLLATRTNVLHMNEGSDCVSIHSAMMSQGLKPYYKVVFSRIFLITVTAIPFLNNPLPTWANSSNVEMTRFSNSWLALVFCMVALGMANVMAAGVLAALLSSSQLAHRFLFRILFRTGGGSLAEKITWVLHRAPFAVSTLCLIVAHCACGAAALLAGAVYYGTILSKMYEEYLEDYVYKIMAKVAAKMFRSKKTKNTSEKKKTSEQIPQENENQTELLPSDDDKNINNKKVCNDHEKCTNDENNRDIVTKCTCNGNNRDIVPKCTCNVNNRDIVPKCTCNVNNRDIVPKCTCNVNNRDIVPKCKVIKRPSDETKALKTVTKESSDETNCDESKNENKCKSAEELEEELHNINFHTNMFILWLIVTAINIPALLTWARNFKYSKTLSPDTSYFPGLVLTVSSACIWNIDGAKANLPHYETVGGIILLAVEVILLFGAYSLYFVNYGVSFVFFLIALQQVYEGETDNEGSTEQSSQNIIEAENTEESAEEKELDSDSKMDRNKKSERKGATNMDNGGESSQSSQSSASTPEKANQSPDIDNMDPEASVYNAFKNVRQRFTHSNDL